MEFTHVSLDAVPITKPGPHAAASRRTFQGIPSIAHVPGGRLFAVWYAGGTTECRENYVLLVVSDDGGRTWSEEAVAVVDPPHPLVRAFDSNLWLGPDGVLRWFWSQSCAGPDGSWTPYDGIAGVFVSELANPLDPPRDFRFSTPRRIANGIMMNKPTVLADGAWLLPCSVWTGPSYLRHPSLDVHQGAAIVASEDGGQTYHVRGRIDMSQVEGGPCFDEHQVIQLRDGSLACYLRVRRGIAESRSQDGGQTWTPPRLRGDAPLIGPNSRFFIARLQSGRLLLVNHDSAAARERLTAFLSDDDGLSWPHRLLLDPRPGVSYPDATQLPDGSLRIIHDHDRQQGGHILVSALREDDILAGRLVSPDAFLCRLAAHSAPVPPPRR